MIKPQSAINENAFTTGTLLIIILLATAERFYGIDRQGLWADEIFAVLASYKPHFTDTFPILYKDSHPPGYLAFMYFTLPWAGYSDIGVRMHSLIAGILCIPVIFNIGRRWFSPTAGLIAATFMASANAAVYYSQEARVYSLLLLLCLINFDYFLRILILNTVTRIELAIFILSSTSILYLHYTGTVFFATQVLLFLACQLFDGRPGWLKLGCLIFSLPLIFYAPWIHVMYVHMTSMSKDWAVTPIPTFNDVLIVSRRLFGYDPTLTHFYAGSIFAALLMAVVRHPRMPLPPTQAKIIFACLFMSAVPIAVFFIKSVISTPIFVQRYFIYALPFGFLAAAVPVSKILDSRKLRHQKKMLLVATILLVSLWNIRINSQLQLYSMLDKDPVREAVALVRDDKQLRLTNYTVLISHDSFEHYLRQSNLDFDADWPGHYYYNELQILPLKQYLEDHQIEYFYYLAITEPQTESARNLLWQSFSAVCKDTLKSKSGKIEIIKYNARNMAANDIAADATPTCKELAIKKPISQG